MCIFQNLTYIVLLLSKHGTEHMNHGVLCYSCMGHAPILLQFTTCANVYVAVSLLKMLLLNEISVRVVSLKMHLPKIRRNSINVRQ